MILRVLLYAHMKLRQISIGVAGEDEVGGFCLHGNEQHLADHGNVSLRRIAGGIGVIVCLAPVAALYGGFTAGSGTGCSAAVIRESPGECGSPADDSV